MTIPAFRIKRTAQAVALALALGASIQVVQAANQTYCYLGIPGMGCNLPTTPGEGVDSTMVGSLPTPQSQVIPPSWSGGNTIAGFLQENAGRTIQIYDSGYYDTVNTGYLSFSASGLSFVTQAQVVPGSGDWGGAFLPLNTNSFTTATALNPVGQAEVGANFPNGMQTQAASSFLGSLGYSVTTSSVNISPGNAPLYQSSTCNGSSYASGGGTINQDMLNAGYDLYNVASGYLYGPNLAPLFIGAMYVTQPAAWGCGGG